MYNNRTNVVDINHFFKNEYRHTANMVDDSLLYRYKFISSTVHNV